MRAAIALCLTGAMLAALALTRPGPVIHKPPSARSIQFCADWRYHGRQLSRCEDIPFRRETAV